MQKGVKAQMKELKYEYVKSLKLAGYLMMNGFRILRVEPNVNFKRKDVYVFEQSDRLSNCIFEYISLRTKENEDGNCKQNSQGVPER